MISEIPLYNATSIFFSFLRWFTVQIDGEDEDSDDSVEETNIMQSAGRLVF